MCLEIGSTIGPISEIAKADPGPLLSDVGGDLKPIFRNQRLFSLNSAETLYFDDNFK